MCGGGPPPGPTSASHKAYLPLVSSPVTRKRYTSPTTAMVRPFGGLLMTGLRFILRSSVAVLCSIGWRLDADAGGGIDRLLLGRHDVLEISRHSPCFSFVAGCYLLGGTDGDDLKVHEVIPAGDPLLKQLYVVALHQLE